MRTELSRLLWKNSLFLGLVLVIAGFLLFPIVDNIYLLIALLAVMYVVLMLWILIFVMRHIKPIEKTSRTMDKILQGNYSARVHDEIGGQIGALNSKVNALARSLSKLKIQEQMQAEQLMTVIENSDSGLVLIDEKGYIHVVNRKFLSMFGGNSKDYIGRLYYDVIGKKEIQRTVQQTFLHESTAKERLAIEGEGVGPPIFVEVVGAPIFDERNMLKGAVLATYDISDFKRLERMRKDFVANVSHELKTPITSIRGFAETLLGEDSKTLDEATREQFLSIIYNESERIHHLIDDLLTLSQLERESLVLEKDTFNFSQLVQDAHRLIDMQAKEKGLTFSITLPAEMCMVTADQQKLKQVVLNILSNAVNYTPVGGTIDIQLEAQPDKVELSIVDSGIGILEKDIPRLFERFYRVDRARSRDTGGTGLGLAIVKHIIEAHAGTVSVESEVGVGTKFTIGIPTT